MTQVDSEKLSINVGNLTIFLPDYFVNHFSIFEDLVGFFNVETNYECEKILKKRFGSSKKVSINSEADVVSIATKEIDLIIQIADFINSQAGVIVSDFEKQSASTLMKSWKRPKKQKWKVGDIFSFPIKQDQYGFAQIIEDNEGLPICVVFNRSFLNTPSLEQIINTSPLAVLMISIDDIVTNRYKIVYSMEPIMNIPRKKGRDQLRNYTFASNALEEILEGQLGIISWNNNYDITLLNRIEAG